MLCFNKLACGNFKNQNVAQNADDTPQSANPVKLESLKANRQIGKDTRSTGRNHVIKEMPLLNQTIIPFFYNREKRSRAQQ